MDVSVIVPIYKGQKYIQHLIEIITSNSNHLINKHIELIFVNDYPEEEITLPIINEEVIDIRIITNNKNEGIQKARINGIKAAKGDYLLMLDQDDEISEYFLYKQMELIREYDAIVSNGLSEEENGKGRQLWSSLKAMQNVNNLNAYFYYGNVIASPGVCLIKKNAIPSEWLTNTISVNGADDWLLWVLFLLNGKTFAINNEVLYTHKLNDNNTSNNEEKMIISSIEACKLLNKMFPHDERVRKLGAIYERRMNMRKSISKGGVLTKVVQYLINPDIAFYVLNNR